MEEINKIYFDINSDYKKLINNNNLKVCVKSAFSLGAHKKFNHSISIAITTNKEMEELNFNFLKIKAPTDVLAFPFSNDWKEGKLTQSGSTNHTKLNHLGDIYISFPMILEQSKFYSTGVELELNIILAHGILHLLGYDHKNILMESKMTQKTVEIIKYLKLDHIKAKLSLEKRNEQ